MNNLDPQNEFDSNSPTTLEFEDQVQNENAFLESREN